MVRAHAWIGVNDLDEEGTWVTPNGLPLTFSDWAPGQPNGHGPHHDQDCVNINYESDGNGGYAWGDIYCTFKHPCAVCRV